MLVRSDSASLLGAVEGGEQYRWFCLNMLRRLCCLHILQLDFIFSCHLPGCSLQQYKLEAWGRTLLHGRRKSSALQVCVMGQREHGKKLLFNKRQEYVFELLHRCISRSRNRAGLEAGKGAYIVNIIGIYLPACCSQGFSTHRNIIKLDGVGPFDNRPLTD